MIFLKNHGKVLFLFKFKIYFSIILDFFIATYSILERKRIKIPKKWIERLKAYRQDLKVFKKIIKKYFSLLRHG